MKKSDDMITNKNQTRLERWNLSHCKDFTFLGMLFVIIFFCYMKLPWITKIGQDGGDGHYAVWAMNARLLHNGELPLWNPYGWGGYCGVGHIHEVFYPVLVLLQFLFWDSTKGYLSYMILPAYTLIHVLIYAVGLYLLLRVAAGVSSLVSFLTTLLCCFSGSMFIVQNWPYISGGVYWTPFLLLTLYLMVETKKNRYIVLSGLCFAMLSLSSTAQGLVFAVINYFLLFISVFVRDILARDVLAGWPKTLFGDMWRFMASGFIGMGVAAVEIFPFLETSALSYRYLPGMDIHETVNRIPISYFRESAIGPAGALNLFGTYVDGYWSITMVLLFFMVYGFFISGRRKVSQNWFPGSMRLMLIFGLLYTFKYGLIDLLRYVPVLNANREPCLYAPFIVLSGGVLAAGAMERWIENRKECDDKVCEVFSANTGNEKVDLVITCLFMIPCFLPFQVKGPLDLAAKLLTVLLIAAGSFCIHGRGYRLAGTVPAREKAELKYSISRVNITSCLLTAAVLMTICAFWNQYLSVNGNMTPAAATAHAAAVNDAAREVLEEADSLIKDKDETSRYIVYSGEPVLPGNIGFVTGDKNVTAYVNPIFRKTFYGYQMFSLLRQIQFENIKYILFSGDAGGEEIKFFESYLGRKTVPLLHKAYSSYNAQEQSSVRMMDVSDMKYGSAWMVRDLGFYRDSDTSDGYKTQDFINVLNGETFDPGDAAFVNADTCDSEKAVMYSEHRGEFATDSGLSDSVKAASYEANRITYQVETASAGLLTTTETYYPGWHVLVDGHEEKLVESNYKFRAVFLDRGRHEVTFYYAPVTVVAGLVTLVIAILLSIILLMKEHWL